jgi:hypothetical protein
MANGNTHISELRQLSPEVEALVSTIVNSVFALAAHAERWHSSRDSNSLGGTYFAFVSA